MLWSFGAINSHLAQSGFEKRVHLPTDFMKRHILYEGQGWQKILYIMEDDVMDVSNVGAAGGYQYQPKTENDLKEKVRNIIGCSQILT